MAARALLGSKLRRLRREHRIAQSSLARQLGISPSYLNLIEHNQRPITVPLQLKLAEVFRLDPQSFARDDEARLLGDLSELISNPAFPDHGLDADGLRDLIGSVPEAGRALASLFRAYLSARQEVESLTETLSEDTSFTTSTHELRNLLASVRSFAEILHDNADLPKAEQRRFQGIVVEQSERLTETVNQMLAFAPDNSLRPPGTAAPAEAIGDFLQDHENHFPALEAAAEALAGRLAWQADEGPARLAAVLERDFALGVERAAEGDRQGRDERIDPASGRLVLSLALPPASQAFRMLRRLAVEAERPLLQRLLDGAGIVDATAREIGLVALGGYLAAAMVMPYDAFLEAARELRYDIERLEARFGVGFEQACRRLISLRDPERPGVPFHLLRVDIAGNITYRFSASGLRIPRFGAACARWNVHAAFLAQGRIESQLVELPDRRRFLMIARALARPGGGWAVPPSHYAVALGCAAGEAGALVYADGLDLRAGGPAVPVGVTCRLCARLDCRQRAAAPLFLPARHVAAGS